MGVFNAFFANKCESVFAHTAAVHIFLIPLAERFASATDLLVSRFTAALSSVVIIVVARRAKGAYTTDTDIWGLTDTLLSDLAEVFIEALAGNTSASLSELIIGLSMQALGAGALDEVVPNGTDTFRAVVIVDLVG